MENSIVRNIAWYIAAICGIPAAWYSDGTHECDVQTERPCL